MAAKIFFFISKKLTLIKQNLDLTQGNNGLIELALILFAAVGFRENRIRVSSLLITF
jgi:hypothetical protein